MKKKFIQVGSGGYGDFYLKYILDDSGLTEKLAGVVDPYVEKSPAYENLKKLEIPLYESMEGFYAENSADLAVISTPIHLHAPQSCYAMEHGSDVLCEKPIAGTLDDAFKMKKSAEKTGKNLSIGYQLVYDDVIQQLKTRILAGDLGKPINFKCCVCWKRTKKYYTRNDWAGRITTDSGEQVYDSPLNNATAHYLNIMYYLSGQKQTSSSYPLALESEIYRANQIENFDTAFMKIQTDADVDIFFATSHAVETDRGPVFELEFENAKVSFEFFGRIEPVIEYKDGRKETLEKLDQKPHNKLLLSLEAAGSSNSILCPVESAMPHLLTVCKIQEGDNIMDFPEPLIRRQELDDGKDEAKVVIGLKEVMLECFEKNIMPSELPAIVWAKPARKQMFENA